MNALRRVKGEPHERVRGHTRRRRPSRRQDPRIVDDLSLDLLRIAGHKLYAAKGVVALYIRRGTTIAPFLAGAGQERGLRPGTRTSQASSDSAKQPNSP